MVGVPPVHGTVFAAVTYPNNSSVFAPLSNGNTEAIMMV